MAEEQRAFCRTILTGSFQADQISRDKSLESTLLAILLASSCSSPSACRCTSLSIEQLKAPVPPEVEWQPEVLPAP
jgi:hypothetical protein